MPNSNNNSNSDMSTQIIVAVIGGVFLIIATIIGVSMSQDSVFVSVSQSDGASGSSSNSSETNRVQQTSPTTPPRPTSTPFPTNTPMPSLNMVRNYKNLEVILDYCATWGSTEMQCNFRITNKGDDGNFSVNGSSGFDDEDTILYDNLGNEYKGRTVTFGNKERGGNLGLFLVSQVQTKASITFRNIDRDATEVSYLLFRGSDGDRFNIYELEFRNFPIYK